MVPVDSPKTPKLKRLAFVEAYLAVLIVLSQRGYSTIKAYVPAFVLPYVASLEEYVTANAAPVLNKAQDTGAQILVAADTLADKYLGSYIGTVTETVNYGINTLADLKKNCFASFENSRASFYALAISYADWLSQKLSLAALVADIKEYLLRTAEKTGQAFNPSISVYAFWRMRWDEYAESESGAKMIVWAVATFKFWEQAFYSVNRFLVVHPYYKVTVDKGVSTISAVQTTWVYRATKYMTYPIMAPIIDPVLDTLVTNPYITQVVSFWTPQTAVVA